MKVIPLKNNEEQLIKKAVKNDRTAQKKLYECHAPKMLGVCRLYIKDRHYAEDVLLKAFFKVFKNLSTYKNKGSFEGWIRRIVIREAIDFIRTGKNWKYPQELTERNLKVVEDPRVVHEEVEQVQLCIDKLPEGYKTVLVLYAVEGYKHREIASLLEISENTSKSQLSKARKLVKKELEIIEKRSHESRKNG